MSNMIRDYIKEKNLVAKTACFGLALVLWVFISTTKHGELKFKVAVEKVNLPEYLTVSDMQDQSIDVVIEGKKELVKAVNPKTIRAVVDLSKPRENISARYPVTIIRDQIPESIRVTASKRKIYLTVERKAEKSVRVIPKIAGSVPDGFIRGRISIEPESVTISGPHSIIDRTDSVSTVSISMEGETGDIVREVEIESESLKNIELSDSEVKVTIPLLNLGSLAGVEIPLTVRNMRKDYRYTLKKEKIMVYVKAVGGDSVTADQMVAIVDVGRMVLRDPSTKVKLPLKEEELEVSVFFRDGSDNAGIVSFDPQRVRVRAAAK
jgi:YbbR domain-containing protein